MRASIAGIALIRLGGPTKSWTIKSKSNIDNKNESIYREYYSSSRVGSDVELFAGAPRIDRW
jgi:hypothetical protein